MTLISFPSTAIGLLAGPLTPMGSTAYDVMHLAQANAWDTDTSSNRNFYDGALTNYLVYYRTADPQWAARGDFLATEQADFAVDPAHLDGGGRSTMAPRDYGVLGMAIHYLRTGYANSLAAVRVQAAGGAFYFSPFTVPGSKDARESAYALMAMLATTVLGGDPASYTTAMASAVQSYLTNQGVDGTAGGVQPNDAWQGWSNLMPDDGLYIINYMQGLVMEALVLYDRIIGDVRIAPAIKRAADWLWTTQWVALGGGTPSSNGTSTTSLTIGTGSKTLTTQAGLNIAAGQWMHVWRTSNQLVSMIGQATSYAGTTLTVNVTTIHGSGTFTDWTVELAAFPGDQTTTGTGTLQYGNVIGGSVHRRSNKDYSNLMGMMVPAFGYCYQRGYGANYKTQGDTILAAMQQSVFFLPKQFTEAFRSSPRYLGYLDESSTPRGALRGVLGTLL